MGAPFVGLYTVALFDYVPTIKFHNQILLRDFCYLQELSEFYSYMLRRCHIYLDYNSPIWQLQSSSIGLFQLKQNRLNHFVKLFDTFILTLYDDADLNILHSLHINGGWNEVGKYTPNSSSGDL